MTKRVKIFVTAMLLFSFSFMLVGYAQLTDTLVFEGSATVEGRVVFDYLYVSEASITDATNNDSVGTMDGSKDAAIPMGWVILNLDFTTSLTKNVKLSVQNNNPTIQYMFHEPRVVSTYAGTDAELTVEIKSGITPGNLNQAGLVYGGSKIASGAAISDIELTITSDTAVNAAFTLQMVFGFEGEEDKQEAESQATIKNALAKFQEALNDATMYERITDQMAAVSWQNNYVGNVVGSNAGDSALIKDVFGDTLNKVSFTDGEEGRECTVMIKKKNVTSSYRNVKDSHEMVLYFTTQDPSDYSSGTEISVFAVCFAYNSTTGQWFQHGDIYSGIASTNNYAGTSGSTSFNTESWVINKEQSFTGVINGNQNYSYTITPTRSWFGLNFGIEECVSAFENAT